MKVLVLSGGDSPEREVSLRSAQAISKALNRAGHQVYQLDPLGGYSGLAKYQGQVDCVLPILHGIKGEDGTVQAALEQAGFKYLGSGPAASKLCFDKVAFKKRLTEIGISTPRWQVVSANTITKSPLLDKAYVLKPIENGSAIDTFVIRDPKGQAYPKDLFSKYPRLLLEELIAGPEITVAILDSSPLPVVEIIPPAGQEFDYENKYNGKSSELCPPKNVSKQVQQRAKELTALVHQSVKARHLSRTDIIVGDRGKLYFLDFNTMPGLTEQSLYPKAALAAGLSMSELVNRFLDLVMTT